MTQEFPILCFVQFHFIFSYIPFLTVFYQFDPFSMVFYQFYFHKMPNSPDKVHKCSPKFIEKFWQKSYHPRILAKYLTSPDSGKIFTIPGFWQNTYHPWILPKYLPSQDSAKIFTIPGFWQNIYTLCLHTCMCVYVCNKVCVCVYACVFLGILCYSRILLLFDRFLPVKFICFHLFIPTFLSFSLHTNIDCMEDLQIEPNLYKMVLNCNLICVNSFQSTTEELAHD